MHPILHWFQAAAEARTNAEPHAITYVDFLTVTLTAICVLLAALGFIVAALAVLGYRDIKAAAAKAAKHASETAIAAKLKEYPDAASIHSKFSAFDRYMTDVIKREKLLAQVRDAPRGVARSSKGVEDGDTKRPRNTRRKETKVATAPVRIETTGQIIERFQHDAPVDVLGLADALGLQVWEDDIDPFSGKLKRDPLHGGESGYSVIVNAKEPLTRKRFTIAHEVAHFILHSEVLAESDIEETLYRGGLSDRRETEANRLAADILMPLSLIEKLIGQGIRSIEDLADALEVSITAIGIRLGASYAD